MASSWNSSARPSPPSRCSMIADEIAEIKARIKHVKELKDSYKLGEASKTWHAAVDPRLSALLANEAHLVGVEAPRDDLVKWILEEGKTGCRVLSVVGFGGLGKTTLANEVLRNRNTTGMFDCRAFISVSQKPVIKKIIKDMHDLQIALPRWIQESIFSPRVNYTIDVTTWREKSV
uniref:Disease resistance RPP13-like protein 4 n=1 Tax=Aegilops tauschii TaxID=37682 RepID=M8CPI4_AEGTA